MHLHMECKAVDANAMTAKLHVQATHLQTTLLRCGAPSDDLAGDKGLMASRAMRHQDSRREVACAVARESPALSREAAVPNEER